MQAYGFIFLFLASIPLLFHSSCESTNTVTLDYFAEWKSSTVHVGDSLLFKQEHLQNLYLFHHRRAFDLCMFEQATLIYNGSSTHFAWQPSRPGHYYFSTRDASRTSCEGGEKVAMRVITPDPSPEFPTLPAPSPVSGGDFSPYHSASSYPTASPSPAPAEDDDDFGPVQPKDQELQAPAAAPSTTEGSIPFISSNPAVPLPMGETDTATILPLPTPGSENQVVGLASSVGIQALSVVLTVVMASSLIVL